MDGWRTWAFGRWHSGDLWVPCHRQREIGMGVSSDESERFGG
jgi:hypothetical protein